jgi:lambda family phage portal protein
MKRGIKIESNIIDKAIEFVAPQWGLERRVARAKLAYSYTAAAKSRRQTSEWTTSNKNADSDMLNELATLRERSRDLVRNSPLAAGAINTVCTNVIGTGLKLQARIDRDVLRMSEDEADAWETMVEREFRMWSESTECDAARILNFANFQELAFRQVLENGDVFILLPRIARKNMPYALTMQLIEADRVCNKNYASITATLAGGIRKNEYGEPTEYHILKQHPGNIYVSEREWQIVQAYGAKTGLKNVLHLFKMLRPGQSRGIPYLTPVVETIKQIDKYVESEVMAAVIAGMFTVFVKSEMGEDGLAPMEPTAETGGATTDTDYKLAPGAILDLAPGEDITTANPGRPNSAFDPFVMAVLRQVGVALEIPFEVLIKHFTASYSAARAALLEAWKFFQARRRWLSDAMCNPIYEIWMYEAVANGRIPAPGYFDDPIIRRAYLGVEWVGPSPGQIDPVKEIVAARERIKLELTTRAYETAQLTGMDWEKVHQQTIKESKMRRELLPEASSESGSEGVYDEAN